MHVALRELANAVPANMLAYSGHMRADTKRVRAVRESHQRGHVHNERGGGGREVLRIRAYTAPSAARFSGLNPITCLLLSDISLICH